MLNRRRSELSFNFIEVKALAGKQLLAAVDTLQHGLPVRLV